MRDPAMMPLSMENYAAKAWAVRMIHEIEDAQGPLYANTKAKIYNSCIEALKYMDLANEELRQQLVDVLSTQARVALGAGSRFEKPARNDARGTKG